ncbi:MAG: EAL domain-containing protein [Cyanobacteria bacterium SBLK]|nr:EAL domain-containing protein [Cyanobacteria bacterium SBLK]
MGKILVIEDDPQIQDSILDILELEDYEIVMANNGRTGVEIALKEQPELIVCDVMMPQMNGYEVLRILRSQTATATTPFIFLTAKADRTDLRQGMELGADDYLTKPFTPRELLQAVETCLAKRAALAREYDERLQRIAREAQNRLYIEPVTGLPNRLTLRRQFAKKVKVYESQPQGDALLGIVSLRIDRFESLRHDLGYQQSDRLLAEFARCLQENLPEQFIAQIEPRKYVILFPPVRHEQDLSEPIHNLQAFLEKPFFLNERKVCLSVSAGIALYPRDGRNIAQLMRAAETALARGESKGCTFYRPAFRRGNADALNLEAELREAIAREQLQVHYQPKIHAVTHTIEGCEALVRWPHPEQGNIPPNCFVPLAEEVGLIDNIGEYVLERACWQLKQWQQYVSRSFTVAVNVSGRQFNRMELRQRVLKIVVDNGLVASNLELELSENSLVRDLATAQRRLDSFRHLGVKIAIDDFGTGYSSLQYLQQFEFDTLKIDRCFIQEIDRNASNGAIVRATIEMAHLLGVKVVAEGVERKEEMSYLQANHCDFIQGFYFSKPLPAEEFGLLLQSNVVLAF